jgi:hypothetical protein
MQPPATQKKAVQRFDDGQPREEREQEERDQAATQKVSHVCPEVSG